VAAISLPGLSPGSCASRSAHRLRLLPGGSRLSPAARRHAPCSVLHRRRFFVPRTLRLGRWALTPPFHPYPKTHKAPPGGIFSVTLSVAPGLRRKRPRLLRGLLPGGVRTFLSRANRERPPAVRSEANTEGSRVNTVTPASCATLSQWLSVSPAVYTI
jgi:hypothetical protein